jgi:hypothetical protein
MKTSYSRRELYAFGEPIGDSSTYETAGRRVYGGGGGGILGSIGDAISDVGGSVSDALSGIDDAITQPVVNTVKDAGSQFDDFVNEEIPGGWALPAIATAAYFGMPVDPSAAGGSSGSMFGGLGELFGGGEALSGIDLGGAGGSPASWLGGAGSGGAGALSGIDPYEIFGSGGSQWGGGGDYMDLGALSGTDLGGIGGSPGSMGSATSGLSSLSKLFGGGSGGGGLGGLTLGGAGLGAAGLAGLMSMLKSDSDKYGTPGRQDNIGPMSQFKYNPSTFQANRPDPAMFRPRGAPTAKIGYAGGGPVEQMSNANALGANTGYPMADINKATYATPYQTPISQNVVQGSADTGVNPMTGEQTRFARGGLSSLGGYSDGGRLLKGPGDGMSDNIPAKIGAKQPARLADGEFVVPADVVSHLGNGSTEAGAKQLYKMMDKIRTARTGRKAQGKQIKADKFLPK